MQKMVDSSVDIVYFVAIDKFLANYFCVSLSVSHACVSVTCLYYSTVSVISLTIEYIN